MTDFDRIGASSPVSKQAAMSSARGEEWVFKGTDHSYIAPPPMTQFRQVSNGHCGRDLTGQKFGRLAVLGLWDRPPGAPKNRGGRWVCRCTCSKYVLRTSKALTSGGSTCCHECAAVIKMRDGWDK